MSLENDLKALDDVTKKEELAEDWKRQKQSGVREIQKKVQARVRAGERTGDPLVDVVLAALGEPNGELFERLRAIDKLFRMSVGEYAYLVIGEQKQFRFRDPDYGDSSGDFRWDEKCYVGFIEDGGIDVAICASGEEIAFPIRKWVRIDEGAMGDGVLEPGRDPLNRSSSTRLLDRVMLGSLRNDLVFDWDVAVRGSVEFAQTLHIGNSAVDCALSGEYYGLWSWYKAAHRLGHPIALTPTIERMRDNMARGALDALLRTLGEYRPWFDRKILLEPRRLAELLETLRRLDADARMLGIEDDPRIKEARVAIPEIEKGLPLLQK